MPVVEIQQAESKVPAHSWWPTVAQVHLLHAALDPDARAAQAWERWQALERIETADAGSRRLFPLVWRNLNRLSPNAPELSAIKPTYLSTWVENNQLFRQGFGIIRTLEDAGIPTVMLKGVANALLYYKDMAARPMSDFDLLVRLDDVERTFKILDEHGWVQKAVPTSRLRYIHGVGFFNNHYGVDLHWSVLAEGSYPGGSDRFWAAAQPVTLEGVGTHALDPADQLLHALTHGARWGSIHPLRWVADTIVLLRATPNLNWDRLVELATWYRVSIIVDRLLGYVVEQFDAPVPAEVMKALHRAPTAWYERADLYGRQQTWHTFVSHAFNYVRIRERARPRPGVFEFLRDWWGLKSAWQVPAATLSFTAAHFRGEKPTDDRDE